MDIFSSDNRSKSFIITHSGKFKSRYRKRISMTDEIWIGPAEIETFKNQASSQKSVLQTQNCENEHHGFSSNVANSDNKLSSDNSILETSSNQNKADYKSAETAT